MLNKNMTTPRVSKIPGAQGRPLVLEFYVNFVQNRSEIVTRGVFEDAKHEYDKAEGIRGIWGPGLTSSSGILCLFCSELVANR